ncbi:DUF1003 domain-containing protein [Mucilaginibacter sp. X5P1]|uniref:DUF1003 domain-containing protein n=1 Tax=Mucilaginibacter sp. X5P1 TaxID=2723088 RepID=UPI00161515A0|nr:DUF1003 domain-containing protein [Mucilaginibacter sp. X5P1]MBB6141442.1 putative membrane protein [Mucilaginibacter sp. X5P1]
MAKRQTAHKQEETQNLKSSLDFTRTRADHFAVFVAGILGSITFLIVCIIIFVVWITYNLNASKPFDPFPFPVLEMTVSIFAIILSVSVLINQNRQGKIDKVSQQVEFEVNVRAEEEITKMLTMLHEIQQKLGIATHAGDKELEEMKSSTDVKEIHKNIDETGS